MAGICSSRWFRRTRLALIVGFVANVGVVIYLSCFNPVAMADCCYHGLHGSQVSWAVTTYSSFGRIQYVCMRATPPEGPPTPGTCSRLSWFPEPRFTKRAWFETRGWPFQSVWCEYGVSEPLRPIELRGAVDLRLPRSGMGWPFRLLPYIPIWTGLVGNTLFFAVSFSIPVWFVPGAFRSVICWSRRRRNRCESCNYDRTGLRDASQPCPECGHSPAAGTEPARWT